MILSNYKDYSIIELEKVPKDLVCEERRLNEEVLLVYSQSAITFIG